MSGPILSPLLLTTGRAVADGLDVVAVGIEHEGAVVAGVVDRAQAGGAVVPAAGGQSRGVEGVDEVVRAGAEAEVEAARGGPAAGLEPEERVRAELGFLAEACGALELHHHLIPSGARAAS